MNWRKKGVHVVLINGNDQTVFRTIKEAADFLDITHIKARQRLSNGIPVNGFKIVEKEKLKNGKVSIPELSQLRERK